MSSGGIRDRVAAHLRDLSPYVPGRPIAEIEREYGLERVVKLASNENPLGPSRRACEAVTRELAEVHRYPDGGATLLRDELARRFGVGPDRVLLGNGSNEILTLLARVLLGPGNEAVFAEGAFAIYALATQAAGARGIAVPMKDFTHDLDAIVDAIGPRTRIVFLGNPNNPTGTIYRRAAWERFLERVPRDVVVVCDDAYAEYVTDPEYPDTLREADRHPHLVVLRTFSKIYGLAGLRIGYGIGPADLVDLIDRLRDPFNVNHLAQVAALGALDDDEHVRASRELNRAGLDFLSRVCRALSLPFVPSHANFLLVEVGDGAHAFQALLRAGVIVRPVGGYGFPGHVRVSIGTPEENTVFAQALAALLGRSGTAAAQLVQPPLEARGGAGG
ncbi:MAG: histidinol-phosphate transaminase [Deltaproteobacteria bacterium]|nr:histidinol-phosphate transaminase [Deltaproteobacteria bacterium]